METIPCPWEPTEGVADTHPAAQAGGQAPGMANCKIPGSRTHFAEPMEVRNIGADSAESAWLRCQQAARPRPRSLGAGLSRQTRGQQAQICSREAGVSAD